MASDDAHRLQDDRVRQALDRCDADAVIDAAYDLAAADDMDGAVWAFRVASSLGSTRALELLGAALWELERHRPAVAAYESLVERGIGACRVQAGVLLVDFLDEPVRGERMLVEAAADGEPDAAHQLGLLRLVQGRFDEAIDLLREAYARDPGGTEAHSLGDALRRAGRAGESVSFYDQAIAAGYEDAILDRAFALDDLGLDEGAEAAFRTAVAEDLDSASPSYAAWLRRQARAEEAESLLRRAAAAGDVGSMVDLGNLLTDRDETHAEGLRVYRDAMLAGSREAMTNLAVELIETGSLPEARALLRQASVEGDRLAAATLDALPDP